MRRDASNSVLSLEVERNTVYKFSTYILMLIAYITSVLCFYYCVMYYSPESTHMYWLIVVLSCIHLLIDL